MTQAERPAWVDERLYPFTSRFLDLDGCRVHYVDEGQGPVLLMLHGNPTWSFLYRNIIQGLRGRFRCIAVDYPGFGLSTAAPGYTFTPDEHAEVVQRLMAGLGLSAVTLFLHDWGGPIGLSAAARDPQRIRALIIGNTFAWSVDGFRHLRIFSRVFGGRVGGFAIRRFNAFVNLVIPAATRRRLSRAEMEHYRRALPSAEARAGCAAFPTALLASRAFLSDVDSGLASLRDLEALIVWGDGDVVFRAGVERKRFEKAFPRATVVELPRAKHYIQEDAPAEIVAAIESWWGATGPGQR
ncbi:MAG TPA: alpha/beta fold hydrolase [Egibacteraceae bacterium]|nr:alpha/beta fold hydrolase [Egibacteraceae bacterium]